MKKILSLIILSLLLVPSVSGQEWHDWFNLGDEEPPLQKPRYYEFSMVLILIILAGVIWFGISIAKEIGVSKIVMGILSFVVAASTFAAVVPDLFAYDIKGSSYSLPFYQSFSDCVAYSGKIYCIGVPSRYTSGHSNCPGTNGCKEIWVYSGGWTKKKTLDYPFWGTSCAVVSGKIYCLGSSDGERAYNRALVYDPSSNTVTYKTLPYNISGMTCVPYGGYIYCFGGMNFGNDGIVRYGKIWKYNPSTNSFTPVKSVSFSDAGYTVRIGAAVYNNKIYIGTFWKKYVYDPSTNSISSVDWSGITETDCPVVGGKAYCFQDIALRVVDLDAQKTYQYYTNAAGHYGYAIVYWNGKLCKIGGSLPGDVRKMYCF